MPANAGKLKESKVPENEKSPQELATVLAESLTQEAPPQEPPKPLPSPFYEDGYTRIVVIPSDLTGFAPVKMSYRPIVADEHEQAKAWGRLHPDKPLMDYYAPLLATKIIDWDIKNQKGVKTDPRIEGNIRRIAPSFYPVLLDVLSGYTSLPDIEGNPGPTLKNS